MNEIKQSICVIKERARPVSTVLPFSVLPKQVIIHLIYYVLMFLNTMPAKTGISETLSPREILLRHRLEWTKHCTGEFGKYVEAYYNADITNSPKSRR